MQISLYWEAFKEGLITHANLNSKKHFILSTWPAAMAVLQSAIPNQFLVFFREKGSSDQIKPERLYFPISFCWSVNPYTDWKIIGHQYRGYFSILDNGARTEIADLASFLINDTGWLIAAHYSLTTNEWSLRWTEWSWQLSDKLLLYQNKCQVDVSGASADRRSY